MSKKQIEESEDFLCEDADDLARVLWYDSHDLMVSLLIHDWQMHLVSQVTRVMTNYTQLTISGLQKRILLVLLGGPEYEQLNQHPALANASLLESIDSFS